MSQKVRAIKKVLLEQGELVLPGLGTFKLIHEKARQYKGKDGRLYLKPPNNKVVFHAE